MTSEYEHAPCSAAAKTTHWTACQARCADVACVARTDRPIEVRIQRETRREARQRRKADKAEAQRDGPRPPRTVRDRHGNNYTVYPDGKRYYQPRQP